MCIDIVFTHGTDNLFSMKKQYFVIVLNFFFYCIVAKRHFWGYSAEFMLCKSLQKVFSQRKFYWCFSYRN